MRSVVTLFSAAWVATSDSRLTRGSVSERRMRQAFWTELMAEGRVGMAVPPSNGGHGRGRRADRAGQAQGRCGEQEARAFVLAQPVGKRREQPDLAEVDPQLEQA